MSFWRTLTDLLLPRHCAVCGAELAADERSLCNVCLVQYSVIHWSCATDNIILRRLWDRHDVEAAGSTFFYNKGQDLHKLFIDIKYRHCPHLGRDLAFRAFPYWQEMGLDADVDCIVPVPLSAKRRLKRGYNQAEWVARGVSEASGIPVRTDILKRTRDNETQTHKTAQQREENTRDLFSVRRGCENLDGKRILLVDDIITTGATISACIHALRVRFPDVKVRIYTLGCTDDNLR